MLSQELHQTIRTLHQQGISLREICRTLKISRNTTRNHLRQAEEESTVPLFSQSHQQILPLLPDLFRRCKGNAIRIQEILRDEYEHNIAYSSLTRMLRIEELREQKRRVGTYLLGPGEEMQHDTSPHRLLLGNKEVTAQCATLVMAYSRRIYLRYFPGFTRFEVMVFLHDAFRFMDGICPRCVIDNGSVIVAGGSGSSAKIAPEVEAMGRAFGVVFQAHRVNNPDRKARVERPFHYVENNFLVGRTFTDWDDLNRQALQWCQEYANLKVKKTLGMSPEAAFLMEKPFLVSLPTFVAPVFRVENRIVDVEGYVNFETNRYSVPERLVGKQLEIHKYFERIRILWQGKMVAEHSRLANQKGGRITTPGHHLSLDRHRLFHGPPEEERLLTGNHPDLTKYVAELKKRSPGRGIHRLRQLLEFKRSYPPEPFLAAVQHALHFGLFDLSRLERLILKRIAGDFFDLENT